MEEAGVGVQWVAERCGVGTDVVDQWTSGESQPSTTQFRSLVSGLKRPEAFFFLSSPPDQYGVPPSFRSPAGRRGTRSIFVDEEKAVRQARRVQRVTHWLRQRQDHPSFFRLSPETLDDPERAAAAARSLLNWTVERQTDAATDTQVLRTLRGIVEDLGVLTMHVSMGERSCRGFSLTDNLAPVLAINTWHSTPARIFSYIHELGHLLSGSDSICTSFAQGTSEQWCDQFAAAFLMPKTAFLAFADNRFGNTQIDDIDDVRRFATRFKVSLRAAAIRLEHLNRAMPGLYDSIDAIAEQRRRGGRSTGGQTSGVRRVQQFGKSYPSQLLDAEQAGVLARHDVLEYLNLPEKELPVLRETLAQAVIPDEG